MEKRIGLFGRLEIETSSYCNRTCGGCIRNSDPDKEATSPWFEQALLPLDVIASVVDQAMKLGLRGDVCLSHYNEPLADPRFPDICRSVKGAVGGLKVFCGSNADFLTEEMASRLDGAIDEVGFSLYMEDPVRSRRESWLRSLFAKTRITVGHGEHMVTHFSPLVDVSKVIRKNKDSPCNLPQKRMIVNHRGDMLLCCDDLTGHFDLGSVLDSTVEELWFSERHQAMVERLRAAGGRSFHAHCTTCPRP